MRDAPPIGLSFRAESDAAAIERIAAAAAGFDFAALSVWDDLGDAPPGALLLALSRQPGNARVGVACFAVPKYASLDGVAGLTAAVARLRPGRAFLGLAAGAWLEQVGLRAASAGQVREAALAVSCLLEGREEGFEGRFYRIEAGFRLAVALPSEPVRLMIGGWGEKMVALAGEIADEVKIGGSAGAGMPPIASERLKPGAARAGRDAGDVGVVLGAVTVVDRDGEAALQQARRRAVVYIPVVAHRDPAALRDFPDAIAAIRGAMARGDVEAAVRCLPDGLLQRCAFAGAPADVIRQVEDVLAAGATRVDFGSPHGLDELSGIETIGHEVLPYFAS